MLAVIAPDGRGKSAGSQGWLHIIRSPRPTRPLARHRRVRDVDNSSRDERTAVIEPHCHVTSSEVCYTQPVHDNV